MPPALSPPSSAFSWTARAPWTTWRSRGIPRKKTSWRPTRCPPERLRTRRCCSRGRKGVPPVLRFLLAASGDGGDGDGEPAHPRRFRTVETRVRSVSEKDAVRRGRRAQAPVAEIARPHGARPAHSAPVPQGDVRVHPQTPARGVPVRRAHGGRVLLAVLPAEALRAGRAGVHPAPGRGAAPGVPGRHGGDAGGGAGERRTEKRKQKRARAEVRFSDLDVDPVGTLRARRARRWGGPRRSKKSSPRSSGTS